MKEELKDELVMELSYRELLRIAKKWGFEEEKMSKADIIDWLSQKGFDWKEYELHHNPYIKLKLRICRFFGIRRGWRIMDVGCGSCGTSIAAASLVGNNGYVLAVDQSEEETQRCIRYVRKVGFEGIIETKLANVMDLEFDPNAFDMIILLYSPQFLGYWNDLYDVLSLAKNWTNKIGIADHIPVPNTSQESIYLLYNWLSNDINRKSIGKKTDRLYHPNELKRILQELGWQIIREKTFNVSKKNAFPEWAMKENINLLNKQIEVLSDPVEKEIFNSRLQTIRALLENKKTPKPSSMYALVATAE